MFKHTEVFDFELCPTVFSDFTLLTFSLQSIVCSEYED